MSKLPPNWQVKSLGEVSFITAGQGAPQGSENFSDKGYPFIRAGSLEKLLNGSNYDQLEKIEEEKANKHRLKLFSKGCILFAKSGMSSMKDRVIVLRSSAYVVSHLAVIQPNENLDSKYLAHWLSCFKPSRLIKDESYPSISLDAVSKINIPLPPLPIQNQIAEILGQADKAKQKRKGANKLTDEFLQSVFIEMFGDPVKNPKGWVLVKVDEISSKVTSGSTPLGGDSNYLLEGIRFIRSQNILMNKIDYSDIVFISEAIHKKMLRTWVKNNDVLFNITGASIGRVAYYEGADDSANVNQHVCIIRTIKEKINHIYLSYLISSESFQSRVISQNSGATRQAFNFEQIKNFKVIKPPLQLQQQFAEIVNKTEALKEKQKQSEKELENLFQSLMQRAFKGKLVS